MILAGDIGGTKTRLGLFKQERGQLIKQAEERLVSKDFPDLTSLVHKFISSSNSKIAAACFGIPGPVTNGEVNATNLPWRLNETTLAKELAIPRVLLVNDLAATAAAIPHLKAEQLRSIHPGSEPRNKTVFAVVAPGTGLGQAFLWCGGKTSQVFASEGGHVNFAPSNDLEIGLLNHLRKKHTRVSIERVVCGPGLANIYEFLKSTGHATEPVSLAERLRAEDPGAVIAQVGLAREADIAVKALDMFVGILGSHVGDMILAYLSTGGVYLGGGIPPKILPKLLEPEFLDSVWNKGRFSDLTRSVPINLILDDRAALTGAAHLASQLV